MCKVSVVIPCYNDGANLAPTLRDVLKQTLQEIEVILVDDGSIDSTAEIIRDLADSDDRIKYLILAENGGSLQSRIAALKMARGKYVMFYDCGDRIDPDVLRDYVDAGEAESADIVIGGYTMELPALRWHREVQDSVGPAEDMLRRLISNDGVSTTLVKLYRRELLKCWDGVKTGGKLGEDFYLNIIAFANAHSFTCVRNTGYHWIYSGIGKKYYMERWDEYAVMIGHIQQLLQNLLPENTILRKELCNRVKEAAKERLCWIRIYGLRPRTARRATEECVGLLNSLGSRITQKELRKEANRHLWRHIKYFAFFRFAAMVKRKS